MKFIIKNESKGRIRVHMYQKKMTYEQADTLLYVLQKLNGVTSAKVYDLTADAVINYTVERDVIIDFLRKFHYETADVPAAAYENSGRALNNEYKERLIGKIAWHYGKRLFMPVPIRTALTLIHSLDYIRKGLVCLWHRKLEVPVLDATAISVSILTGDYSTASSIMFLLGIGGLLEEWTHKKSVDDLARSMALNIKKVWLVSENGQPVLVDAKEIQVDDKVIVHMGNVIPFDGYVAAGEGTVNQASLTGESVPVVKRVESTVYAGTVVEEGELTICVKAVGGSGRFDKIVAMIEDSEKLKSSAESQASHLADRLVPWTLGTTALTYAITRNTTKALSVLMVDFCCALNLAMPISVLSAIREAGQYHVTVKGGKFMEAIADATTIVFDKTGTLTKAKPTVAGVVTLAEDMDEDEALRIAACMEEHFPHSMATAVVEEALRRGLEHEEMHSEVKYIVAHGIATMINGRKYVIGSRHFVLEDEKCEIPEDKKEIFESIPKEYSHLYMAAEDRMIAVINIEDPLREEASDVVSALRQAGFDKIVMMTGDSRRTAEAIAAKVGMDEVYAEVLPEDKARFVEQEKANGRKVVMIGDGINDSPALSAADVGIAISDGSEIAREIADVTVDSSDLYRLVTLKQLSVALMKRIHTNYREIVGFNTFLIILGILGVLPPTTTALLHNSSTILISLNSMKDLLEK